MWLEATAVHRRRIWPFLEELRLLHTHGGTHPVYDFLFSYYSFTGGQLLRWTPGVGVRIEDLEQGELEWPAHLSSSGRVTFLNPQYFPKKRLPFLRWAITFLKTTAERAPVFHCFGLHEWAMVYRAPEKRYPNIALRVSTEELEHVIEEAPLRCTHYDAFRFFSEDARPMNRVQLGPKEVVENDQPGCIHATMDLYRLAYKAAPYISSELLGDLFLLARDAREIDMRASPYDLSGLGFEPIPIETKSGREAYVEEQRKLCMRGQIERKRLLAAYQKLLIAVTMVETQS